MLQPHQQLPQHQSAPQINAAPSTTTTAPTTAAKMSHHQPPDANNNQHQLQQLNAPSATTTNAATNFKSHQTDNSTNLPPQTTTTNNHQMHVCALCDKLLSSSSSLDRHMLTHSGERPFVCKRCHMTFTTNGNMHRHMRTHLHKDSIARQQQEQQLKSSSVEPTHQAPAPSLQAPLGGPPLGPLAASTQPGGPAQLHHLNQVVNFQNLSEHIAASSTAASTTNTVASPAALAEAALNFHDPFLGQAALVGAGSLQRDDIPQSSVSAFLNQLLVAASNFRHIESSLEANNQHPQTPTTTTAAAATNNNSQQQQQQQLSLQLNQPTSASTMSMSMDSPGSTSSELGVAPSHHHHHHSSTPQPLDPLSLDSPQPPESLRSIMMSSPQQQSALSSTSQHQHQHHSTTHNMCGLDSPGAIASPIASPHHHHPASLSGLMMDSPSRHASLLSVDSPQPHSHLSIDSPQPLSLSATANHQHHSLTQTTQLDHSINNHQTPQLEDEDEDVVEDISQSYVKTANPNAARKGGKRNRHCYKCKLCTYSSVDRCTLVRHLRIHSGERPYICGICRYAFTTKANCERHVRKRHKRQYNSLGGPGGGGIKGSNGGGRSLIITDHSNHQTIPVKVNPVAAQTISQTLQRIQDKHEPPLALDMDRDMEMDMDMDMDSSIERLSEIQGGATHNHNHRPARKHQSIAQHVVNQQQQQQQQQQNLYQGDSSGNYEVSNLFGHSKSKRKQRDLDHHDDDEDDDDSLEHTRSSLYQRHRVFDKQDSAQSMLARKELAQDRLSNSSFQMNHQQSHSLLDQIPKIPPNNELFSNLVALLQQVKGGHQQESNSAGFAQLPNTGGQPAPNVTNSATYLATMLAAAKSLRASQQEFAPDDRLQQTSRSSQSLFSPQTLHEQLCKPNSQQTFFIGRNPFDAFNAVDLAAQALDLSCKFQSSK